MSTHHGDPTDGDEQPRGFEGDSGSGEERERSRNSRRRGERKEKILHTRISEQLAEDIRAIADDLRVPVSNLVRNVLEEAFSAAERVTDDVGDILDEVMGEAEKATEKLHRFRERHSDKEDVFRERMETASEQIGRAAESFADAVDRMAQRSRDRAARRAAEEEAEAAASHGTEHTRRPAPDPEPARAADFGDVVAWQPVVLNTPQRCAATGETIPAGAKAYMGIGSSGFTGLYVGEGALPVSQSA
ncbi:MAG: hypothetical protein CL910_03415 [Deltaproteobacteria bacterium]|jgi:hypothetical protein|nr:hypothetical protein [Deltaproteobacteria bacterium]